MQVTLPLNSRLAPQRRERIKELEARNAQNRLRRLAGQVGLAPENCRRVQAAALFGSVLWWKGDGAHGTKNRQEDVQKAINQEARLTLGAFRTANQGALSLESGLRPAPAQRYWTTGSGASPSGSPAYPGRPSQGTHRSPGQHARPTTPVIPRVLERKGRDGPT